MIVLNPADVKVSSYMADALTGLSADTRMLIQCRRRVMFRHENLVRDILMGISKKNRTVARGTSNSSCVQVERDLLIAILETISQSRHINVYLERLAEHVKNYSGCRCVGIRLLDDDGNIPYASYTGFSREFYENENHLCIESDKCMCVNVIMGNIRSGLPSYTKGGSFLSNGTTKLLASVSDEIKRQTRNVCNQYGYESVALVPMTIAATSGV